MIDFLIYSFYHFKKIKDKERIKKDLNKFLKNKVVRGTILLANEGINASISGEKDILDNTIIFIENKLGIRKITYKVNSCDFIPFNKIKVRLKKEIVSLGVKDLKVKTDSKKYVDPTNWDKVISDKQTKVIDVRNTYETNIGGFKNKIDPKTNSFREFPRKIKHLKLSKNDKIAIYCTGGIRCEKALAFLNNNGFKNVIQLEGGILNYLDYKKKNKKPINWQGECFVFDDRVTVNKNLKKGKYFQCYGCRSPITRRDTLSKNYLKGAYCPKCYNKKSKQKIRSSLIRQKQIDIAIDRGLTNPFIKIRGTK